MCRDGLRFVNRGVFVSPDGEINIYDKRKSFGMGGEDQHYQSGSLESIVSYKGWNINLQICYDLRFPELSRNRIERNGPAYDVLIYVANWPEKRIEHWKVLLKARAIENQCFVLGVNRIGEDGNKYNYSGDSLIFNALGTALIQPNCVSQVIYSALNHSELEEVRTSLPFLKDR
jgi:predicted amidohydrolase